MVNDFIFNEEELFESFEEDLLYEYIEMDYDLVPPSHEKKLTRYYKNINSIWFARSKIKDGEAYYYFGLMDDEKLGVNDNIVTRLILKFDEDVKKSNIRFSKGNVYISCMIKDNNPEIINKLPTHIPAPNGKYYLNVGKLGNNNVLKKIEELIRLFDFEVTIKKDFKINNFVEFNKFDDSADFVEEQIDLDVIKNNLEVIKLKKFINETIFDDDLIDNLNSYLFTSDEEKNYRFNQELYEFNLSTNEVIDLIKEVITELDDYSFEKFKVDFKVKIKNYGSSIQFPKNFDLVLSINDEDVVEEFNEDNLDVVDDVVAVGSDVNENDFETITKTPDNWDVEDVELNEEQMELYDEYLMMKDDDWIIFEAERLNLSENNCEIIFSKIKHDISINQIDFDDDVEDTIISYFNQFSLDGNSNIMMDYFNQIIDDSSFYDELLNQYSSLNEDDINDIISKVKLDINTKNLSKNDILKRLEFYFKNKSLEIEYKNYLLNIDKRMYMREYNLYFSEIDGIINQSICYIKNWYNDLSVFNDSCNVIFNKFFNDELDSIKSNIRREFEARYENKEIILSVLNISIMSDEEYNKLIDEIYNDINRLHIRLEEINDYLIEDYYNQITEG